MNYVYVRYNAYDKESSILLEEHVKRFPIRKVSSGSFYEFVCFLQSILQHSNNDVEILDVSVVYVDEK